MTLTVTVHPKGNPAGASIRTLAADFTRGLTRVPNDAGGGLLSLPINHADAAFLEPNHWLKFHLDGQVVMSGRLGPDDATVISPEEEAGEIAQVKVQGALSTLADAQVYRPSWFADRAADMRWFGPMSPEYEGWTSWDPPAFYVLQDYALSPYGTLFPEGWLAGSAGWIWGTAFDALSSPPQAVGKCLFAAVGTLAEEGDQLIQITADDGYRLWIDGILVGERREAFGWKRKDDWPLFLTAGSHFFFIEGENIDRPSSPATNGAAILFAWFTVVSGGEYGDLVGVSSDSWTALPYPVTPVGMTAGDILDILLSEARFRGACLPWTWDFTATLDSAGNAWARELSVGFRIGTNLLDVVRALAAFAIDVTVDFDTLTLHAFNKGALDTSPSVTLAQGTNILSLAPQRTPALATDAYVQTSDQRWQERTSGVADTGDGDPPRIETYVQLGGGGTDLDGPDQADPVLDAFSTPKDTTTVQIVALSGRTPFVDFTEFDTIQAPNRKSTTVDSLVKSITVVERGDDDGVVDGTQLFVVEVTQEAA